MVTSVGNVGTCKTNGVRKLMRQCLLSFILLVSVQLTAADLSPRNGKSRIPKTIKRSNGEPLIRASSEDIPAASENQNNANS